MSEAIITKNLENAIQKLGGQLKNIHSITRWKYFPHVLTEDLQKGYFEKLENLHSQQHTYYIGELPTFSMVEMTAAYAKDLVERYF